MGGKKMNYRIGVVEDDPHIQKIVKAYLEKERYEVIVAGSAEAGLHIWRTEQIDMWIIDIMLPGMDGFEFCKMIRDESEIPIVIISAKDEEIDKVLGLELGSDDYLTKPFSPRELVARIKRLFKRTHAREPVEEQEVIRVGSLLIQVEARRVYWQGKEIEITTKEFDLLQMFGLKPDYAFSREILLERVWGMSYFGSDRAVDDLVKRLRQKLVDLPLETIWGFGYRLRVEEESL